MSYYQAGYQDRAPVSCGVSTGFLLQSKSLYNSVCERDQLRTFRKLGASSEKQSDTNSQSVVPRGAFEHPISGPGDMAAAHNLVSGSQSYHSRPGSCPIPATDAMVLPRSHFSAGAPPPHAEVCTSSAPSSRTTKPPYAYDKPVSYPQSLSSSSYSSLHSAQEFRTVATRGAPPSVVIQTHPSDSVVSVGERAEFTCKAIVQGSVQKPRYMWCKDNQPLVWEIGQHCVVESACAEDAGEYLCLVSDPQGHVTVKSWAARLTVKPSLSPKEEHTLEILKQPEKSIEVVLGEPLRLEVVVKGYPPPTYQWYKDTVVLPYATASVLEIVCMTSSNEGDYCCSMTNSRGSRLSARCTVRVLPRSLRPQKPTFLPGLQPMDLPSDDRQSTVKPLRSGPPLKEEPISQAFLLSLAGTVSVQRCSPLRLGSYLELTSQEVADITHQVMSDEERTYFMLRRWVERKGKGRSTLLAILKKAGMCVSNTTESEDTPKLQIHVDPQNPICYGNSVTLRVLTNHTPNHHHLPLGYQWYKDGRPLERRRSRELSIYSFTEGDCGEYTCSVTMPHGEVLHTQPALVSMASENPLRRVPPNYGVMVTNTSQPPRGGGGAVVAAPSHLYYDDDDGGDGVEKLQGVWALAQPSVRTARSTGKSLRIITHPQSQELQPGDPLTITCIANGPTPLSYLWLFNGLPLINETEPTYRINCFTDEDEGMYACEVTASDGSSMLSDFAEIRMNLDD